MCTPLGIEYAGSQKDCRLNSVTKGYLEGWMGAYTLKIKFVQFSSLEFFEGVFILNTYIIDTAIVLYNLFVQKRVHDSFCYCFR